MENFPIGEYGQLDIQRVPTFIIYKSIEAGRIIENPVTSLETGYGKHPERNDITKI